MNASCQASNRMLNNESLTNSDNSIAYFRKLNAASNVRQLQAKPAVKPKAASSKSKVMVKGKVGVAAEPPSSKTLQKEAKKA